MREHRENKQAKTADFSQISARFTKVLTNNESANSAVYFGEIREASRDKSGTPIRTGDHRMEGLRRADGFALPFCRDGGLSLGEQG